MNPLVRLRDYYRARRDRYRALHADLVGARMGMTPEQYLARAVIVAIGLGLLAGAAGYLLADFLFGLQVSTDIYDVFAVGEWMVPVTPSLPSRALLGTFVFLLCAVIAYQVLAWYPGMRMRGRESRINLSIHNAVAYMYAMRRGGAEMLDILRSLAENDDIYGETATEFRQVIRDVDYFGCDVITAVRNLAGTTPSMKLRDFLQDLLSVMDSGGDVAAYLSSRVRLYQDEARFEQKQFITTLEFVAEAYVTLFVAGPLFLIIIMVVMGLIGGGAITQMAIITYLLVPVGSLIFIVFIDMISERTEGLERFTRERELGEYRDVRIRAAGGEDHLFQQLARYDRVRKLRDFVQNPLRALVLQPHLTFFFTVPAALVYLALVVLQTPSYTDIWVAVDVVDDHLILAMLLVLVPYAVFHELWRRKVLSIEGAIPEFLDRMAGINQVGLTLAQAIAVMVRTNLGVLSYEIRRIKRDLEWGANVQDALVRFEDRVRTPSIARTVTLITKASQMSGDIGEILNIAASDSRMTEVLKKERSGSMLIYVAIVYLAFVVFLFVVAVISTQFLPLLSTGQAQVAGAGGAAMAGPMAGFAVVSVSLLTILLYHACLIQGLFSGLIAGQMGEGSVRAGVKHTCILLIIALIVFNTVI